MSGKLNLVLASSSAYRKTLLRQAGIEFVAHAPDIDESVRDGETASDLVQRLSRTKAEALSGIYPDSLIVGSDQIADCKGELFGKPRDHHDAVRQLQKSSASMVTLHTGLAVLDARTGNCQMGVDTYEVVYRFLDLSRIETYLKREKPYDCCGSLKVEGPGIAFLERLTGNDPNTLMGLPLLMLIGMLDKAYAEMLPL